MVKEKETGEDIFSTRDLYLAATLITLKFPMIGVDFAIEGTRSKPVGYFKFEESVPLRDARQKYLSGLLAIEPRAFTTNMHALKAEVVNYFNSPHGKNE